MLAIALAGCQEYPFSYRPKQRVAVTSVREVVVRNSDTDILFVIDSSASMQDEQDNLRRNARAFIETLSLSENAYRIGIITTDALDFESPGQDGGRLRMRRATQTQLNTAGCGIGPDTSGLRYLQRPALDSPQVDALRCRLVEDMAATVGSIGTDGSGLEAGLLGVRKAVDPASDAATANSGFIRPAADLAVVFLTDEEDCSYESYPPESNDLQWCYENIANATPLGNFIDFLVSKKDPAAGVRKIRAALIGGGAPEGSDGSSFTPRGCRLTTAGEPSVDCGCWNESNDAAFCEYLNDFGHVCTALAGCTAERCDAMPSSRYYDFLRELRRRRLAVSFPGGTFADSICRDEYDETLLKIANTVVLSTCFVLQEPALGPDAVQVAIRSLDSAGATQDRIVPRFDSGDSSADCQTCGGECAQGAWRYVDERTFCLECGLKKEVGQEFVLTVLNELEGVGE
ncbi:MAG: vWA domain-containing protein [Myxococcota bacterium]|nr:vWA domain-containing protein [Myxococcota bacterium]